MQRGTRYEPLWQDRDIRFDAPHAELTLRSGEKVVESFSKVEDTKGNTGEVGRMVVTNLRLIWQSLNKPRINLSIGFNCVSTITSRMMHTRLRGRNESLYLMTKVAGTRYEFIFIRLEPVPGVSREMVDLVARVCKAYVASRLYRDLRLRSAIIAPTHKQLKMLPSEQIYNTVQGVWNLSSDQGNLGTMYLTNVRVVWHANINELFNISLPYVQIRTIKVRESKFGIALVIESSEASGGYVLGFRLDPVEKLNSVFEELHNLYLVHSTAPDFGVNASLNFLPDGSEITDRSDRVPLEPSIGGFGIVDEDSLIPSGINSTIQVHGSVASYEEIEHESSGELGSEGNGVGGGRGAGGGDPVAAYLAEGESTEVRAHQWTYHPGLGLALEKIKDGFSIESLWEVVESSSALTRY